MLWKAIETLLGSPCRDALAHPEFLWHLNPTTGAALARDAYVFGYDFGYEYGRIRYATAHRLLRICCALAQRIREPALLRSHLLPELQHLKVTLPVLCRVHPYKSRVYASA